MMTEGEIREVANEVLARALGTSGFERAEVTPAPDHEGDPSLFVLAHIKRGFGLTDAAASTEARASLRMRLLDLGEDRFPYLRFDYPDDEILGDDEAQANS